MTPAYRWSAPRDLPWSVRNHRLQDSRVMRVNSHATVTRSLVERIAFRAQSCRGRRLTRGTGTTIAAVRTSAKTSAYFTTVHKNVSSRRLRAIRSRIHTSTGSVHGHGSLSSRIRVGRPPAKSNLAAQVAVATRNSAQRASFEQVHEQRKRPSRPEAVRDDYLVTLHRA